MPRNGITQRPHDALLSSRPSLLPHRGDHMVCKHIDCTREDYKNMSLPGPRALTKRCSTQQTRASICPALAPYELPQTQRGGIVGQSIVITATCS
eukprot:2842536-Pyramimonas_sp.AAC.1